MNTVKGAVALVTGASTGLGEGLAKMLAAEGARVALLARRQSELERVAREIGEQGGMALVTPADLADEAALRRALEKTETAFGPVDILVNDGGVMYTSPVHTMDMQALDTSLSVNLRAPVLLCSLVLPGMRARRKGYIINIGSEAGAFIYGGMGAYAISKHALRVLTGLIQEENQDYGIKAWAICPGFVHTSLGSRASGTDPTSLLTVREVVDLARFLLSQGENVKMGPEILIRTTRAHMRSAEEIARNGFVP